MTKLILVVLMTCGLGLAQTATPAQKSAVKPPPKTANSWSSNVTQEEVDSFMKHMFGFQAGVTWKVTEIAPAEAPGVTRVVVQIGGQSQAIYVLPGGKFALVGEVIPFGADPFAPARNRLAVDAHGAIRGSKDAPVTLVEFTDLECPHCKTAQPIIEKLIDGSPNAKLIYQPFPLPMHPWAKQAAEYAECVHELNPDASWRFTDSVYESQADIPENNATEKLNGLVRAAGLDAQTVVACAAKPEIADKVQRSIDLGLSVGVNSTPTLFIDGRKVLGISEESLPSLKAMIDYAAKQPKR